MARILIIEPNRILGRTYRQALLARGHQVLVIANAQSAIHAVDGSKPDIIVLEPELANNDGVEFLYELRSYMDLNNIPVIVQSLSAAYQKLAEEPLARLLGVTAFLYKAQTRLQKFVEIIERQLALSLLHETAAD